MIAVSILFLIFSLLIFLFPSSYLGELALSFLPYRGGVSFIGLISWVIILWRRLYHHQKKLKVKQKLAPLFLTTFWIFFLFYLSPIQNFYHQNFLQKSPSQTPIRILFSNLYKDNFDFEAIQAKIKEEKPDLLLFVEFSEGHKNGLEAALEKEYPYRAMTTRSKIAVWDVVFSKYPINHLADDFPQWTWRYGYFSIEKDGIPYYFYLIHTSSPVNKSFFRRRNLQLQQLSEEFQNFHLPQREKDAKVILVGDLNISPRSVFYRRFADNLSGQLENATRNFPMLFTRNLGTMLKVHEDFQWLPGWIRAPLQFFPLQSHIDHLFISPEVILSELRTIQFSGSDHCGFVFDIE